MAEGSTIGALKFILGADTAQLEAATGKASASMRAAARAGEIAGQQIAAAFTRMAGVLVGALAVERIVSFSQAALRAASDLGRFSDQAGLTAQQFQGLDFAMREAQVPTEQLAQGFAIFARNFSDLQRNTGPFLDFLRQAAPGLVQQFRAARDTYEAFGVLTDTVNRLGDQYDRIRILNAAGAEQFAKLANTMRQGRGAIDEQVRGFQGLTDAQIRAAQEIERQWNEVWRKFTLAGQQAILGVINAFREAPIALQVEQTAQNVERLKGIVSRLTEGTAMWKVRVQELQAEQAKLNGLIGQGLALSTQVTPAGPATDPLKLQANAIKAAQGELALFMARLNGLPQQMTFVSTAYAAAWDKMRAVMQASGETAKAIEAARLNLLMQQEQARLAGLQSIGITMSIEEQYQQTIQRTNSLLERGIITTQEAGRAHQIAALTAANSWAGAMGQVAGALAQAFPKQKAFAVAAAVINVAEGITKALSLPFPMNWVQAAAVAASGLAQINAIKSANPGSGQAPSVKGGAAAGGTTETQAGPTQTLMVQGIDPNAIMSGASVRDLAERLLAYQRDGGQVVLQ